MERDIFFINAVLTHLELLPNFHDENTVAFFPYFHGGNPTFWVRCITAHKMLFSPSIHYENTAKGCPIFMAKIWQSYVFGALWCTARVLYLYIQLSQYDECN